jgi:hypothetical protein
MPNHLLQQSIFERLQFAIAPALLLCANLVLFGTFAVYVGNPGEFLVAYAEALAPLLLPASVVFTGLVLLATLLGPNRGRLYNALIIFLATITYIHGSLLLWDTGVLDGAALDHSESRRSIIDGIIWLSLAGLALRYRMWLALHGWKLCSVLLLFQLIGVTVQFPRLAKIPRNTLAMPEQLPVFSNDKNVIHIVLDAFQANVFEQLLNENPLLADQLTGFTFFRDALTSSDVTYLSVPATLSGKAFTNETTITEYQQQTLGGANLYTFLAGNDYAIDVATPVWWNHGNDLFASYYRIPAPYADREQAVLSTALQLIDISIYRQLPYFLKARVYNHGNWQLSSRLIAQPELQFQHFAHNKFLRDLTVRMSADTNEAKYKFIHLVTPHAPLVSRADCSFTGAELQYSMSTFAAQSSCTMHSVLGFIQKLKDLDLYDRSTLIIHGDHGGGVAFSMRDAEGNPTTNRQALHRVWGNPLPLVLVKPPGANGGLKTSETPVSLLDIPATVADLLEKDNPFPGVSMYDSDRSAASERVYYRSTMHRNDAAAKDRFDNFSSYTITGSIYDVTAWSDEILTQAPVTGAGGEYTWGTALSFGATGTFEPFQNGGWIITAARDITWTRGFRTGLSIPFAEAEADVLMKVTFKPLLAAGKLDQQNVTVLVGNEPVAQWQLTEDRFQTRELRLPASMLNRDGSTDISFVLPDARSPESLGTGSDKRILGLAFLNLQFDLIKADQGEP